MSVSTGCCAHEGAVSGKVDEGDVVVGDGLDGHWEEDEGNNRVVDVPGHA